MTEAKHASPFLSDFHAHVGEPRRWGAMSVFPLFRGAGSSSLLYLPAEEAMETGLVRVEEVSLGGSVPELTVENKGEQPVLFLEGEALEGAKQNRILNTSVLVGPKTQLIVPVSCVEQGRWRRRSASFSHRKMHASGTMRRHLKKSLDESLKRAKAYRSDQRRVWKKVEEDLGLHGAASPSADWGAAYERRHEELEARRRHFGAEQGAVGLAVSVQGRVCGVDLFDGARACRSAWDRLLSGYVMDALHLEGEDRTGTEAVQAVLQAASNATWFTSPALGLGVQRRCTFEAVYAAGLWYEDRLVHGSLSVGD